jgi:hypothetical protein
MPPGHWLRNYIKKYCIGNCVFHFLKVKKVLFSIQNLTFFSIFISLTSASGALVNKTRKVNKLYKKLESNLFIKKIALLPYKIVYSHVNYLKYPRRDLCHIWYHQHDLNHTHDRYQRELTRTPNLNVS